MKNVTLKFPSLQLMAECMFQLGITKPTIDYDNCLLTALLNDQQILYAKDCKAEVIEIIVSQ
jgi:hypothetical protein